MNCPSKTDPELPDEWNQNPDALSRDTTTRSDLSRIANARIQRDHRLKHEDVPQVELVALQQPTECEGDAPPTIRSEGRVAEGRVREDDGEHMLEERVANAGPGGAQSTLASGTYRKPARWRQLARRARQILLRYIKFIGPGFMISVAYIDPGNYATDVSAGATYRFRLLFMVLVSNIFAIFLQSLCIKLGSVTGLNLAEMCKVHCPAWLNYTLYFFAESAIIATDIAEVIGTAIALNMLLHIPLVAGCAISILDVLFILLFYQPDGNSMRALRAFEFFVMLLVLAVVVCFCVQLSLIKGASVEEVFRGYLPSSALVQSEGLYQSCGILGATVMPHSLYLGSGIIQARLKDFDKANNNMAAAPPAEDDDASFNEEKYRPSISAIKSCMSYSIVELAVSLFTFALFVNSAILIVAGASLSSIQSAQTADLFGIHRLLSHTLAPAAGTIFALALLLSGISAGIVCTIAGQMVSEGQLSLSVKPWVRRLITRSISITPSIIIAGAVGADGLSAALEGTQVALSVILPFVSAPLIYFTCRNKYMTVGGTGTRHGAAGVGWQGDAAGTPITDTRDFDLQRGVGGTAETLHGSNSAGASSCVEGGGVKMRNHWVTATCAVGIWCIVVVMNIALLVLVGLGVQ